MSPFLRRSARVCCSRWARPMAAGSSGYGHRRLSTRSQARCAGRLAMENFSGRRVRTCAPAQRGIPPAGVSSRRQLVPMNRLVMRSSLRRRTTSSLRSVNAPVRSKQPARTSQRRCPCTSLNASARSIQICAPTYIASRAAAYELQAALYMSMAEGVAQPEEKRRLQSEALLTVEALRHRAFNDFRQFTRYGLSDDASARDVVTELDSRLAAKRHRLAALLDQQNPAADKIASVREEIALLRTKLDVAQGSEQSGDRSNRSPQPPVIDRRVAACCGRR